MNLEDSTLSEIRQTHKDKHCVISHVASKIVRLRAEDRMGVVRGWGYGGNEEMSIKEFRVPIMRGE